MTISERAELAAAHKRNGECNCCQAVLSVLSDQTGLEEQALRSLGSGFAVGMGGMEGSCGALIGAVMAAGLAARGAGMVRCARQMSTAFLRRCGAVTCKALKGAETGRILCSCEDCVRSAVMIYGQVMQLD